MMSFGTYLAGKRKDWKGLANRVVHCRKKRYQIESFVHLLSTYCTPINEPKSVLDLCGGRGDLSLVLAYLFPSWKITIMDRNVCALEQAKYRAKQLGLMNIKTTVLDLFNIPGNHPLNIEKYDVVLGLHACGSLTDVMLDLFGKKAHHLFIATCCFGKVRDCDRSEYSSCADADGGGNSEISRLAKVVINSRRIEKFLPCAKIIEMNERCFGNKNQLLYIHS
jgi:hypothetical protein